MGVLSPLSLLLCASTAFGIPTALVPDGHQTMILQSNFAQSFELTPHPSSRFFLLEIEIWLANAQVALVAKQNAPATSLEDSSLMDETAMSLNKTSHFLLIPHNGGTWFATVFNFDVAGRQVAYKVALTESEVPICAKKCMERGTCIDGKCHCRDNFISEDCGLLSYRMTSKDMTLLIPPKSWRFITFSFDSSQKLNAGVQSVPSDLFLYYRCSDKEFTVLASADHYDELNVFTPDTHTAVSFDTGCGFAEGSVYNCAEESWSNVTFSLKDSTSSKELVFVYIISGVVFSVLVFWGVFILVKMKRAHAAHVAPAHYPPGISHAVITTLFPQTKFESLSMEKQSDCPICLEAFAVEAVVRVLPCKHVYHCSCIDLWLSTHKVISKVGVLCVQARLLDYDECV